MQSYCQSLQEAANPGPPGPPRAQRLPVRASPPLSDLTAVRCSFYSLSALIFEVEKGPEQKSSRRYTSMTCGAAALGS